MNKENLLRVALPVAAVIASVGVGFAGVTSAQSMGSGNPIKMMMGERGEKPAVVGKVTATSGTTLTVEGKTRGSDSAVSYTVDASSAKVLKGQEGAAPAESSVSAIAVGDMVAVRGTLSGTSVAATEIMDGLMMGGMRGHGRGPGTFGSVSAISGSTITITGKDGKTYTVDASGATVSKMSTISVGDIKVGDDIGVMGQVSGTSVTAKHIMDGMPPMLQQ